MANDAAPGATPPHSHIWNSMVAGGLSGVVSRFLVYPIDTIKTRLQVRQRPSVTSPPHVFAPRSGMPGLYFGFSVVLVSVVPGNALYFGGYEFGRTMCPPSWGFGQGLAAGICAQLLGGLVFTPMDVVKERCQARMDKSSSPRVATVIRGLGWRSLLKGYWVSNAMWLPWSAIYASVYGKSKAGFEKGGGMHGEGCDAGIPAWGFAACSGWSAIVASTLTHPIDVVKTQMQVLSGTHGFTHNSGAMSFFKSIWMSEGWRGLGRGYVARIASIAPQSALSWMLYETTKSSLEKL